MKKTLLLGFAIVSLLSAKRAVSQIPAALQSQLQDTLFTLRNNTGIRGLSVSVGYKNLGIWKSAVGEADHGVPLSTEHLIGIGSNTKTFVSVVMLMLMENGEVNLNDTIGNWITGYPNISCQITVRQLLNHTSGLFPYTENPSINDSLLQDLTRFWTKPELLSFVDAPLFEPGTNWSYSNTNYIVAAMIEEQIIGTPFEQFIRDSILTPGNLQHTFYPPTDSATNDYASFLMFDGTAYDFFSMPHGMYTISNSSGGLASTAEDNTKFWQALFNGSFISPSTVRDTMLSWITMDSTYTYGLGIFRDEIFGNTVFSHSGSNFGQFNANLVDTVNDIYVTVLSNQDSLWPSAVLRGLYKVALDYSLTTGKKSIAPSSDCVVFPNPSTGVFRFTYPEPILSYTVYSLEGKIVSSGECPDHTIDISLLPPGLYQLQLQSKSNHFITTKISKR